MKQCLFHTFGSWILVAAMIVLFCQHRTNVFLIIAFVAGIIHITIEAVIAIKERRKQDVKNIDRSEKEI